MDDREKPTPRPPDEPGRRDGGGSYTQRPAHREPERVTRDEDEESVERRADDDANRR